MKNYFHRFIPGAMYGMLMFFSLVFAFVFLLLPRLKKVGYDIDAILEWLGFPISVLLVIVSIIGTELLFLFLGRKIFEFTERIFARFDRTADNPKRWAVVTEFSASVLYLLILWGVEKLFG